MPESKSRNRFLIALLLLTVIVRGGVMVFQQGRWDDDVDAYLGIARQIAAGAGFSVPNSDQPTAYRPPLYPCLLALAQMGLGQMAILPLHLLLGLGTVFFTWRLGTRLVSETAARWAACLIAFDPLLLQYSTQPMTETLCAFLAAWTLNLLIPLPESRWRQLGLGLVLGLCVLSRPTFLVFGVLFVLGWVYQSRKRQESLHGPGVVLLGMLAGVLPWGIRNAIVFGEFRATTTHGGYTLLLGNNPVFYDEVVNAPWGAVWTSESLTNWQASLETEIRANAPEVDTESERDRWMARRARDHIADNPGLFLKACGHRFLWFWNVFPPRTALDSVREICRRGSETLGLDSLESAAGIIARTVAGVVALFYLTLIGSFAVGLVRLRKNEWEIWWPLALLIASFCAVHLFYWTDTRMRAPVMPAVVLMAVRAWFSPATQTEGKT